MACVSPFRWSFREGLQAPIKRLYGAFSYVARRRLFLFSVLAVSLHVYFAWAFGAVYWVDAFNYMELGDAMKSASAYRGFIARYGPWLFPSYIGPGIPLLSVVVREFPVAWQWPALAAFQRLVAAGALIYAVRVLDHVWPSPWHYVAALGLMFLPFYQSFHNSLMSESIAGSLVILSCALAIRLLTVKPFSLPHFAGLLICLCLQTQIRLSMAVGIALVTTLTLVRHRALFSWKTIAFGLSLGGAVILPVVIRLMVTGMLILPLPDFGHLRMSIDSNVNPSPELIQEFADTFPGLGEDTAREMMTEGLVGRQGPLTEWWRESGISPTALSLRVMRLCSLIGRDSTEMRLNSVRRGLTSCGLPFVWRTGDLSQTVWRGRTMKGMLYKQLGHYRWLSWTYHDSYIDEFQLLVEERQYQAYAAEQFIAMCKPYLSTGRVVWRDPLRLGRIFPDLIFLAGMLAAVWLCRACPWVGAALVAIFVCHYLVHSGSAHGNIRYAYPLAPVCFMAIGVALAVTRARFRQGSDLTEGSGVENRVR